MTFLTPFKATDMLLSEAHSNAERIPRKMWIFKTREDTDMWPKRRYLNFYAKFESTGHIRAVFAMRDGANTDIMQPL